MPDNLLSHALPMPPASPAGAHDLQREQKHYLAVYAVLVAGTVLTVAMYYVHFEALWQTVTVALLIAAAKAACVAAIFMHMWHGQRDVYKLLFFTGVFVATLFVLTTYSLFSLPGSGHYLR
ncbi:MAG TPA: cytochrome C oxidase subunit IV family protein [Pirellulales bacterium]|nr:cytochrome C oxidase subunit IV family protein [Pirellulales bacterium]